MDYFEEVKNTNSVFCNLKRRSIRGPKSFNFLNAFRILKIFSLEFQAQSHLMEKPSKELRRYGAPQRPVTPKQSNCQWSAALQSILSPKPILHPYVPPVLMDTTKLSNIQWSTVQVLYKSNQKAFIFCLLFAYKHFCERRIGVGTFVFGARSSWLEFRKSRRSSSELFVFLFDSSHLTSIFPRKIGFLT